MKSLLNKYIPKLMGFGLNMCSYVFPTWVNEKSLSLFCTTRSGRLRPKDRAFLETCDSSDNFTTEHGSIEYYQWNKTGKKTVLLLHGWESNAARWRFLIKELLKNDYCVLAVDAPAHGASSNTKFDMLQYIAAINKAVEIFDPNVIVGHSVGGASLSFYLSEYDYPAFDKLVFLAAPTDLSKMIGTYFDTLALSARLRRSFYTFFEKKYDRTINSISASTMLKGVKVPSLIVHSKDDEVVLVEAAQVYHELLVNSKLLIADKLGHSLQDEGVYEGIIEFLKEPIAEESVELKTN